MKSKLQQFLAFYSAELRGGGGTSVRPITITDFYDEAAMVADFGNNALTYMNQGMWDSATSTRYQAGTNLLRTVVDGIVARAAQGLERPVILDVACGLGATTQYLRLQWPHAQITGINITDRQLALCRRNAPGCEFRKMDATELALDEDSVDFIVCIEAAFQFRTRRKFFDEARRVLKPGGVLAATDVLVTRESHSAPHPLSLHHPPENQIDDAAHYRGEMIAAGFERADVSDITERGALSYFRFHANELMEMWRAGNMAFSGLQRNLRMLWLLESILSAQLLVFGVK